MTAIHRALGILAIICFTSVAQGAQFFYDPMLSGSFANQYNGAFGITSYGTTTIFGFPGPPPVPYSTTAPGLVPHYSPPVGGPYDWGNDATGSAQLFNSESSAASFVTYNGDGTNQIKVRVNGETLLKSDPPPDPLQYSAIRLDGTGAVGFSAASILTGLAPGQPFAVHYTWDVNASAGSDFFDASAQGRMRIYSGGIGAPTSVFDTGVFDNPGFPSVGITPSGMGDFFGVYDPMFPFFIVEMNLVSTSSGQTDPSTSVLAAANFFGEATFTIQGVPEPASICSMGIGSAILLLGLWRIRRRTAVAG